MKSATARTERQGFTLPTPYRFGGPKAAANATDIKSLLAEVERLGKLVTHQASLIDELNTQANRDPLTGLANRRGMETHLSAALSDFHRYGHRGAVLMIDLNHFKAVNDTYGHAAGDALLGHVADLLRRNTRESDLVARLGGDEFLVVLRETTAAQANGKAIELRYLAAETPCETGGLLLHPSLSIGVATFAEAAEPRELLALADQRMYLALKSRNA
jgi:diguanylate cyclase (GGDEF)-like protein